MSEYADLLDATIAHLRALKAHGQTYLPVDMTVLQQLQPAVAAPSHRQPTEAVARAGMRPEILRLRQTPDSPDPQPVATAETLSPKEALSAEQKEAAMAEVRCRALQCHKCSHLASTRKNVVFGVGTVHTDLMFVGEAPGADEDQQGEPFVGKAGQLLTKIIQTMGMSRDTVYIGNVLKCRPDTPGQLYGNRKPTPSEMATCLPYLLAQIDIIRPKVIVALGATAMEGLFGKSVGIMKARGNWHMLQNIPVMPTFHPAYLLRNQALTEKRKVWEDMLQVLEKLGRPITEKQRGYFLTAK